jgi:hypothetical protein
MINVPALLAGQSKIVDSASNNFVSEDTVIVENILKTPELQVEKTPEKVSPTAPMIPMTVPGMSGMRHPDFLMPPRYLGYESAMSMLKKYTDVKYDSKTLNLHLDFSPPKSLRELISEDPLRALLYIVGAIAGRANHTVMGEDKMNKIRLDNMIQSHSGIPESAISGNGAIYYEIDTKNERNN